MMKNKLMLGVLTVLLTVLFAFSQTAVAQDAVPSGYPIIGSVISQQFNSPAPFKPAKYRVSLRPQHGTLTLLDDLAGIYQYQSYPDYVGEDSFSIVDESSEGPFGYSFSINVTESVQYVVTKTEDTQDGVCDDDCSFSEAVEAANTSPGIDVVVIPAGVYPINPQTLTDHLIIDGADIGQTSLLGNGFRTNGADLQLSNLSYVGNIFDPNSSGIDPFIIGGARSISLYRVKVTDTIGFNSLWPGLNGVGRMLAFESEFLRYGCGAVLVGDEIIASRIAVTEGGGDINCSDHTAFVAIATQNYSMIPTGTVNLFSSTIYNNFSMPYGLISIWPGNTTSFNMINTSIHNNAGNPLAALIHLFGVVDANIINSTVVGNSDAATFYAGLSTTATVWLTNNILAYNNVNYNSNTECGSPTSPHSPFISRGSNFFTSPNSRCNLHPSDIVGDFFLYEIETDPYLPLENFQYIVPSYDLIGIIDGADNDYCPHVDIQGFQRPFDNFFDGDLIVQCDIGAYEVLSTKPNILANGISDYLVLNASDLLTLTITLDTRYYSSAPAEWWVYADTPMGPYYFNSATNSWQPGQGASYQQAMFESQKTIPVSSFPAGLYKFYFNVDHGVDGENLHVLNAAEVEVLLVPTKSCDANGDDNVDRNDIILIMAARNTAATGSSDPRDHDGDGIITVLDARQCVLQCDLNNCAVQ